MSKITPPINLNAGKLQTAEEVKGRFNQQLDYITTLAKAAALSKTCGKRLKKARRIKQLLSIQP